MVLLESDERNYDRQITGAFRSKGRGVCMYVCYLCTLAYDRYYAQTCVVSTQQFM